MTGPPRQFLSPSFGDFEHEKKHGRSTLKMTITSSSGVKTRYVLSDPRNVKAPHASVDSIIDQLQEKWTIAYIFPDKIMGHDSQHLECVDDTGAKERLVIHARQFDVSDVDV